jgi:hypothetical protein
MVPHISLPLFEFAVSHANVIIIVSGLLFALIGLIYGKRSGRFDNYWIADGYQGASVASLILIAIFFYNIDNPKSLTILKEQIAFVSLNCFLLGFQCTLQFWRSL